MKVILSEILKKQKQKAIGRDEARIEINDLEHKEEISIQPEEQEEKRIKKKNEDSIKCLWDTSRCTNVQIIGMPEGEEEEQEIENLFEKIMKENFPNLEKEIDFSSPGSSESPKEIGPKEEHTKAHHH